MSLGNVLFLSNLTQFCFDGNMSHDWKRQKNINELPNRLAFQEGNIHILYMLWHLSIDFLTPVGCQQVGLNSGPSFFLHLQQWQREIRQQTFTWFLTKEIVGEKLNLISIWKKMNLQKEKKFNF